MIRAIAVAAFMRAMSLALAMAASILLARLLGVQGLGLYAGAMAIAGLLTLPAAGGIPAAVLPLFGRARAVGNASAARGVIAWAARRAAATSLAVVAVASLATVWFVPRERVFVYVLAYLTVPLAIATGIAQSVLQGCGRVIQAQVAELAVRPATLLAALAMATLGAAGLGVETSLALQAGSFAVASVTAIALASRALERHVAPAPAQLPSSDWATASRAMFGVGLAQLVLAQADIVLLTLLSTPTQSGLYRVALSASAFVAMPLLAVEAITVARVIDAHAAGSRSSLQSVLTSAARLAAAAAVPFAAILIVSGEPLLKLVYGGDFGPAAAPMAILAAGQAFNVVAGTKLSTLIATGHQRSAARALYVAVLLDVLLGCLLIPRLGSIGAALAASIALAAANVLAVREVRRHLGVDPTVLGRAPRGLAA
jgi:O-antigen/teichoic acid export membrane protein